MIQFLDQKFPGDTQELFDELQRLETERVDHFGKPCGSPIGLIETSWPTIRVIRQKKREEKEEKQNKEREIQIQRTRETRAIEIQKLEDQVRAETDSLAGEYFDRLSEVELNKYLKRVHERNPSFQPNKGSPAATALIRSLIREDLKLDELEIRKLAELSLRQASAQQAVAS